MVDNHQLVKSKELLTSIITDDYFYSPAHSLLGFVEAIDSKTTGAGVNELKIALKMNPMETRSLISYGNGTTDTDYQIIEKDNPNLKSSEYFFNENKEIIRLPDI
ncbi:MAG: hypothetical protein EOO89_24650 [Pedobacter sp.]|nr:MAG: hypothetical protein EOO89_24650 [Pedobacter sp.]